MEKHFEGTLPFQASNVSDLKSHFGVDEEDTDSDWDPDAWPEQIYYLYVEHTNCICTTNTHQLKLYLQVMYSVPL